MTTEEIAKALTWQNTWTRAAAWKDTPSRISGLLRLGKAGRVGEEPALCGTEPEPESVSKPARPLFR